MFKCLILLTDSVSYGKQVIYSLPQHISILKSFDITKLSQKFRRNPVSEILTMFLSIYGYFGDFSSKNLFGGYCQDVFINSFSGSSKYPQLCITINKDIFISKTVTFKIQENHKTALNSINVIGIIDSSLFMQSAQYLINFLANILQTKEKTAKLISKQLGLLDIRHSQFRRGIKQLIIKYHRPNQQDYWYQIQAILLQQIRNLNNKCTGDIEAIQILKSFWQSANLAKQFHYQDFHTHTGLLFDKSPQQGLLKNNINKSLLFSKTRIRQTLGSFYSKDFSDIIQKYLHSNKSLKKSIKQHSIDQNKLQNLIEILMSNNLAIFINPIRKYTKYISCIREKLKPSRMLQFQELFSLPYVQTLKQFENERSAGKNIEFNQLRFLLLNGVIKDLDVYVFDRQNNETLKQQDQKIKNILKQYSFSGTSIQQISALHSDSLDIVKIRAFLNQHRSHIGLYYVQSD